MSHAIIQQFIGSNIDKLPQDEIALLRYRLGYLTESELNGVLTLPLRQPFLAMVFCIFFRYLGIHRFYLGQVGLGFLHLFCHILISAVLIFYALVLQFSLKSWGLVAIILPTWLLIWLIMDIFTIWNDTKLANLDKVNEHILSIYSHSRGVN